MHTELRKEIKFLLNTIKYAKRLHPHTNICIHNPAELLCAKLLIHCALQTFFCKNQISCFIEETKERHKSTASHLIVLPNNNPSLFCNVLSVFCKFSYNCCVDSIKSVTTMLYWVHLVLLYFKFKITGLLC